MKHSITKVTWLLLIAVFSGLVSFAQNDKKPNDKMEQYDEIIIKKKSDKNVSDKLVIEINDGNIKVNGKPLSEFNDDNLSVRKKKIKVYNNEMPPPPPPPGAGSWGLDDNQFFGMPDMGNSNKAMLGVITEKADKGVKVTELSKGSAAEKAGLKVNDIITKVDEVTITDPDMLRETISQYDAGEKVTVTYLRDKNKEQKLTVTLDKRPSGGEGQPGGMRNYRFSIPEGSFDLGNMDGLKKFYFKGQSPSQPKLGVKVQDTDNGKGVKVIDVDDDSNAGKAGIKENDIITSFDEKDINSASDLADAFQNARSKASVNVKLLRNGKQQSMDVKIPKNLNTMDL